MVSLAHAHSGSYRPDFSTRKATVVFGQGRRYAIVPEFSENLGGLLHPGNVSLSLESEPLNFLFSARSVPRQEKLVELRWLNPGL